LLALAASKPAAAQPSPGPSGAKPAAAPPGEPETTEVVVYGKRPISAPPPASLKRSEVRELPGAFGDPFRAIEVLPGVTAKNFMRTPGSDRYVTDDGVTLRVEGSATRVTRTLTFAWSLRQTLFFNQCGIRSTAAPSRVSISAAAYRSPTTLRFETEGLFRNDVVPENSSLAFAPFAEADARGNGDGAVDLEELAGV
jgi:hypothetical protein